MPVMRISKRDYEYITKNAYAHRQSRTQYLEGLIERERDYQRVAAEWERISGNESITETIHPVTVEVEL